MKRFNLKDAHPRNCELTSKDAAESEKLKYIVLSPEEETSVWVHLLLPKRMQGPEDG